MKDNTVFDIIAKIHTDFPSKFGVPRQSGLVPELEGEIVFEPEYRNEAAIRGLEGFSHLWLLWKFSKAESEHWHATVRPPRLGGNTRIGVFATRSPFRPNPIGLSCVKLLEIKSVPGKGPVLVVSGVDLIDQTPIYDIKPYIPYTDAVPNAAGGFTDEVSGEKLKVEIPPEYEKLLTTDKIRALRAVLANDPRPAYQNDQNRIYAFEFAGFHIRFTVQDGTLKVEKILKT